jgi:hypothetical protein
MYDGQCIKLRSALLFPTCNRKIWAFIFHPPFPFTLFFQYTPHHFNHPTPPYLFRLLPAPPVDPSTLRQSSWSMLSKAEAPGLNFYRACRSEAEIPFTGPCEIFTPLNVKPIQSGRRPFHRGEVPAEAGEPNWGPMSREHSTGDSLFLSLL